MDASAPTADLLVSLRKLVQASAADRRQIIRENIRTLMILTGHDPAAIHSLTGVSSGTVRNYLRGTDSSLGNVLLIALSLGVSLGDLERPPAEFQRLLEERGVAET